METHVIKIKGIVQGVGFRPFIYNLAKSLGLNGYVRNDTGGVTIEIQGNVQKLKEFEKNIISKAPPRSRITDLAIEIKKDGKIFKDFEIIFSVENEAKTVPISPDLFTCDDCLAELFNPEDRRYLYPFINCTNCGPRFTIVKDIPYDRENTTMSVFKMCKQCQDEYNDPTNRRFHAQPNACFVCGPHLYLVDNRNKILLDGKCAENVDKIFKKLRELINAGKIIAIKGIGGFHLACNAEDEKAVKALRCRKYREDKPFAVMFPDIETVKKYCYLTSKEDELLLSVPRPIVLLKKIGGKDLAWSVVHSNKYFGIMLPYTPVHHLLMRYINKPLVMTSGNFSDEPIVYKDDDALLRLRSIADYFLLHNREIYIRCDDSVTRVWAGKEYIIRKSRGYVPGEMLLKNWQFEKPTLALGPEQKNTFSFGFENKIITSHHIGDMDNLAVYKSFINGINHFKKLYEIEPEVIVYDKHPEYLSTKYAMGLSGNVVKIGVQHHHAHAVSCMVDNQITGPVIAVTFDGTGYGEDGTIWGGEILIAELSRYMRVGYLSPVLMPGGTSAIKNPWQMAISYLYGVYGKEFLEFSLPFLEGIPGDKVKNIIKLIEKKINSPVTTSCGRLFDGVASIAGIRNSVNYEGQAAVEFEQAIDGITNDSYHMYFERQGNEFVIMWDMLITEVVDDVLSGKNAGYISAKFHSGLAKIVTEVCLDVSKQSGLSDVVLSGGVFMNMYLLERVVRGLRTEGLNVFTHNSIPTNDGGISVGQLLIGDAILKERGK